MELFLLKWKESSPCEDDTGVGLIMGEAVSSLSLELIQRDREKSQSL